MSNPTAPPMEPPPPSYDEAAHSPQQMPPTYDSLYGEFRRVESTSQLWLWIKKLFDVIFGTLTAAIVLAFLNIVPLTLFIVGILTKDKCPTEARIPMWMYVTGAVMLSIRLIEYYKKYLNRHNVPSEPNQIQLPILVRISYALMQFFFVFWFILGCFWVFGAYSHSDHCDPWAYQLSFIFICVTIFAVFFTCCCACCCWCCFAFKTTSEVHVDRFRPEIHRV